MPRQEIQLENTTGLFGSTLQAVEHAIVVMNAALAKTRYSVPRGATRPYLEMRRDLPYYIHDTAVPTTQIVLNRHYKPLGYPGKRLADWVEYDNWPSRHVQLTRDQILSVVSPGLERGLFDDVNPPWAGRKEAHAYVLRLETLAAML